MKKGTLSLAVFMILSSGVTYAEEQIRNIPVIIEDA